MHCHPALHGAMLKPKLACLGEWPQRSLYHRCLVHWISLCCYGEEKLYQCFSHLDKEGRVLFQKASQVDLQPLWV